MNHDARRAAEALFKPRPAPVASTTVFRAPPRVAPCPVCAEAPADRTNPSWAYRGMACSEECGKKASAALRVLWRTTEWRMLEKQKADLDAKMREIEADTVRQAGKGEQSKRGQTFLETW